MRYFTAVVAHGSIAKAAAELNIAASAVSAAPDQVEEAFDLTLLTRQRARGIEATASGREIAQKFERLLDDYQAILSEGAELKQALGGELRVGYYAPVAPAFLPAVFADCLPPGSDERPLEHQQGNFWNLHPGYPFDRPKQVFPNQAPAR